MTTKKIYGPWIKWHGGECPVPPETMVQVKLRGGIVGELRAGGYSWRCGLGDSDIVEYCVVLEQAAIHATAADAQAWAEFDRWCRGGGA